MTQEMCIRNYSEQTIRNYIGAIAKLCRYYNSPPDKITTSQVKKYIFHRVKDEDIAPSTINQIISGWKILQLDILKNDYKTIEIKRPRKVVKIPAILSREQVLKLISFPKNLKHRTILTFLYSTGIRLGELLSLKPSDIDSIRMVINIRSGKGNKDRQVILNEELLRIIFHDIKSEAFKPLVLGLIEYHQYDVNSLRLSDESLITALKSIRTYLIRRRILGLTQGENKNIVTFSKRIPEIASGKSSMLEFLTNMIYRLRLPNDTELSLSLKTMNFYKGLSKYSKLILGKIEENNTKVAVDFRNKKVTIEHIMPQKIEDNWKTELGDNYEEIHKTYIHNIGNLILTEFNSEIGNKSFQDKKIKLNTSSLNYRLDIVSRDIWNEQSIIEHQTNMINWLLETFPLPLDIKESSNWNTQLVEKSTFSPLESDAGEMAEGNKPQELHIGNKVIKVKYWQDVLLKFLKELNNNPEFDFEFILENQLDLFSREETILKWRSLKEIIDANFNHTSRYKTFDGKVWDKVKDLNDDLLFVHINISASRCMLRIARIMEKFNIPKDDVIIQLR